MEQELIAQMHQLEDRHWWFRARRSIIKKLLSYYVKRKNNQILEIGCGTGGNLELLAGFGTVSAVECDKQARSYAAAKNIAMIKEGSLPDNMHFQQTFDVVCMLDVLEHIDDDIGAVRELQHLTKERGKVLITVPAYQWLWSDHDVMHHHKRRYNKKQLTQLLSENGFHIVYCSYFNTFLLPVVFIVRKVASILSKKTGSDVSLPSRWVNCVLQSIFSFERHFFPWISFPFGVSILVFAKKS